MELDIAKAEAEIARLQAEVEAEKKRLAAMTPEQVQAELLHSATCNNNHDDACGWYYEKWSDYASRRYSTRRDYVEKAKKIQKGVQGYGLTLEQALKIYTMVRGY